MKFIDTLGDEDTLRLINKLEDRKVDLPDILKDRKEELLKIGQELKQQREAEKVYVSWYRKLRRRERLRSK